MTTIYIPRPSSARSKYHDILAIPDPEEEVIELPSKKVAPKGVKLPLEVFNDKPIDSKKAWEELKRSCGG